MPRTVWHTKKRILTEDELRTRKDAVVEHMQQITTIEAEKKVAVGEFTRRLKPHQTLVKDLMAQITTGVDEGRSECEVQVDTVTQTVRFIRAYRKWNEDTLEYEHVSELFDEKTFDEVGEKQLSMWQDNEVDDSVDDVWSVLAVNELEALGDLERSSLAAPGWEDVNSIAWEDAVQGLLTPMAARAAALFLRFTNHPDTFVIQTLKNVGLREALELIEDARLKILLAEAEEVELGFLSGVFSDVEAGQWLLSNIINIPHREADSDIDGINFHGDETPEEVAEGEDGDE